MQLGRLVLLVMMLIWPSQYMSKDSAGGLLASFEVCGSGLQVSGLLEIEASMQGDGSLYHVK